MIFENYIGPLIFFGSLALMFLAVPLKRIKDLLHIGIIGGFGIALLLLFFVQIVFGFWTFQGIDLFYIFDMPLFIMFAWSPLIILFSHLLTQYNNIIYLSAVILAFPLGATILHYFFIQNNMLFYNNWSLTLTFFVSLLIHLGITWYLYITNRMENIRNALL